MIRIAQPQNFILLIAVGVILVLYFFFRQWRKKTLKQLADSSLLQHLIGDFSPFKSSLKFFLMLAALFLIIIGLVNPQWGNFDKNVRHNGIDIAFVIDVSNSMQATDAAPNRLEVAKKAMQQLAADFPESRIAIVVFAGSASTLLPLSPDHAAVQMVIATLSTEYAQVQGTDLGGALQEAMRALPSNQNRYRAMVIFSDGEDHEQHVNETIRQIRGEGIVICAAAIGTEQGSEIPLVNSVTSAEGMRDPKGSIIVTKVNSQLLKQLAAKTNGVFVSLQNSFSSLKEIATRLNAIQKNSFDEKIFVKYESRFQYFLLPALLLLIADVFTGNRSRKKREQKKLSL